MALADDIDNSISDILNVAWNSRDGTVVPTTDKVTLKNGAVNLDATYLYADLAHSTELARVFSRSVAAKIVRSYLSTMSRLINASGGDIRSFDGDRVMGVFLGGSKNSNAAKCALQMHYVVSKQLRPMAEKKFPSLVEKGFVIDHCAGIATGQVMVVRAGVRESTDLVSIGSAPNLAAKLSGMRTGSKTYMTHQVYKGLGDKSKYGGSERQDMWTSTRITLAGEGWDCYKSTWTWKP